MWHGIGCIGKRSRRIAIAVLAGCLVSAEATAASVYECRVNGQRVFSDQRCGADSRQREINASNTMTVPEIHQSKTSATAKLQRKEETDDGVKKRERCDHLREQIKTIHSRMRAGYSAAQGIRLDEQLRKLNERYTAQRCEYFRQ